MSAGAGANKVLTTNASGIASWQTAAGGWDGILPNYTTAQRNALSLADGLIVYNTTDNAVQIYKSGAWANVGAKLSLAATCSLDGDCDSTHCVDGVCCNTVCSGTVCQTCNTLSSNGVGYCGYVTSGDPRNNCTTATPGAADSCKSPNCNGTGYACGYLSGEANQPICKQCSGTSFNPYNIAVGTQDTAGTYTCTAAHYRCDGTGGCTAPCGSAQVWRCAGTTAAECKILNTQANCITAGFCAVITSGGACFNESSCFYGFKTYCWDYLY